MRTPGVSRSSLAARRSHIALDLAPRRHLRVAPHRCLHVVLAWPRTDISTSPSRFAGPTSPRRPRVAPHRRLRSSLLQTLPLHAPHDWRRFQHATARLPCRDSINATPTGSATTSDWVKRRAHLSLEAHVCLPRHFVNTPGSRFTLPRTLACARLLVTRRAHTRQSPGGSRTCDDLNYSIALHFASPSPSPWPSQPPRACTSMTHQPPATTQRPRH